jgi:shikimate kinase
MPDIAGTADAPWDRRCGGEEPELWVSLVGVSCVGTTTIGRILADRRGWPFFDLDEEIKRHFGLSIGRLQARFLTGYSYRKECAAVLERIATANPDCVIALPPSGLRDAFLRVVRRVPGVTVAVHDTPENILERITFYDIDSRPIDNHLSAEERILYLKEIKADISYFKRSYERADPQVTITGLDPEASAAIIDTWLGPT